MDGDRLRVCTPMGVITAELHREIAAKKEELLAQLRAEWTWPAVSLEFERCIGTPHAKLIPLIGRPVTTAKGKGELWQAYYNTVGVVLESAPTVVTWLDPDQVRPNEVTSL